MIKNAIGILGGLGPLATAYFMNMIIRMTDAASDQQHIDMIVYNHASIPDRTEYILDNRNDNPLQPMIDDAVSLEKAGVTSIFIPCNTAHYFYREIQDSVQIPVINIIEETVYYISSLHLDKKIGILATDGTIQTRTYQRVLEAQGVDYRLPSPVSQKKLMDIIYSQVKAGNLVDIDSFMEIIREMREAGCTAIILGCTELSVIKNDFRLWDRDIVDSLEVLAKKAIQISGKKLWIESHAI